MHAIWQQYSIRVSSGQWPTKHSHWLVHVAYRHACPVQQLHHACPALGNRKLHTKRAWPWLGDRAISVDTDMLPCRSGMTVSNWLGSSCVRPRSCRKSKQLLNSLSRCRAPYDLASLLYHDRASLCTTRMHCYPNFLCFAHKAAITHDSSTSPIKPRCFSMPPACCTPFVVISCFTSVV